MPRLSLPRGLCHCLLPDPFNLGPDGLEGDLAEGRDRRISKCAPKAGNLAVEEGRGIVRQPADLIPIVLALSDDAGREQEVQGCDQRWDDREVRTILTSETREGRAADIKGDLGDECIPETTEMFEVLRFTCGDSAAILRQQPWLHGEVLRGR